MDLEEITKLVDGIYKNILDKFNPGARQLITAGKAYLKALHGAAAASRVYVDAINKLAKQAQQGTWGASSDIGSALMQIVDVYKEIQAQQMNILKAFYVDLLVPLETNLEKDTKVVQSEQKRFLAQHKQRSESYSKAAAAIKKQRKKTRAKPGIALDREVKSLQTLEEERAKLDAFCEASLKTAMTQERRRYGFVLERQCSLAKHYLLHHTECRQALEGRLESWQEVSQSREALPEAVEAVMAARLRQVNFWSTGDETTGGAATSLDDDHASVASQLRKTKSMDASCLDMRSIGDVASADEDLGGCPGAKPLSRAKSEFDLSASTQSLVQEPEPRPKSMAVSSDSGDTPLARAMHAYLSSGDNQLSFLEGDVIALMGERIKGWQFGENLRTQSSGWFPLAYTEVLMDMTDSSPTHGTSTISQIATSPSRKSGNSGKRMDHNKGDHSRPTTRQGNYGHQQRSGRLQGRPGPPPLVPAPVPRRLPPASSGVGVNGGGGGGGGGGVGGVATTLKAAAGTSLHSSNDSGFSNEPPPLPEADYSDDDSSSEKTVTPATTTNSSNGPVSSRLSKIQQNRASAPGGMNSGWGSTSTAPRAVTTEPRRRPENGTNDGGTGKTTNGHHNMSSLNRLGLLEEQSRKPSIPVKRTKSLWKFRRGEQPGDILEGMSLWRHRSLVDVPAAVEASEGRRGSNSGTKPEVAVQTDLDSDSDEVDQDSGSESCIVVEDHRRAPAELPPPPPPPSGPAPTPAAKQQQQIPVPAGRQRNAPKHKKMSLVSNQGKGSVSMPWYRLWSLDPVSVN